MSSFCPKHIIFQLEYFRRINVMTLKGDAKFNEKLTRDLKNDIRNLVNFHMSSQKSDDPLLYSKAYKVLDEKVHKTLKSDAKFEEKLILGPKNDEEFGEF